MESINDGYRYDWLPAKHAATLNREMQCVQNAAISIFNDNIGIITTSLNCIVLLLTLKPETLSRNCGGATPWRARSNDLAGRSTALAQALAPPFLVLRIYRIWHLCFILMVKRRSRPVFWGRELKKGRQLFLRKKVHPGDRVE